MLAIGRGTELTLAPRPHKSAKSGHVIQVICESTAIIAEPSVPVRLNDDATADRPDAASVFTAS